MPFISPFAEVEVNTKKFKSPFDTAEEPSQPQPTWDFAGSGVTEGQEVNVKPQSGTPYKGHAYPSLEQVSGPTMPLSDAPVQWIASDDPQYKQKFEKFVRDQAPRQLGREAINAIPFAQRVYDSARGVYNDPVHPERTFESTQGFTPTEGNVLSQGLNAVNRTLTNPGPKIENLLRAPGDIAVRVLEAAGPDKSKTGMGFAKEMYGGVAGPTGLADVQQAYRSGKTALTFPKARAAFEEDLPMAATILHGGIKGVGSTIELGGKAAEIGKKAVSPVTDWAQQKFNNGKIEKAIRKVAPGPVMDTPKAAKAQMASKTEGVLNVARLRDEIELPDANGFAKKGGLPKSQAEHVEAVSQGLDKLINWQSDIFKNAGTDARVDINPVREKAQAIINEPERYTQAQIATAKKMLVEFPEGQKPTLDQANAKLTALNNDIKSMFTGKNNSGDAIEIVALAANNLKEGLVTEMEKHAVGPRDLRKDIGSLLSLRTDSLRALEKKLNKGAASTGMSVFDILGIEQVIHGSFTGNIRTIATGVGSGIMANIWRWWRGEDRAVKNMYKAADTRVGKEWLSQPEKVVAEPVPPEIQTRGPVNTGGLKPPSTVQTRPPAVNAPLTAGSQEQVRGPVNTEGMTAPSTVQTRGPANTGRMFGAGKPPELVGEQSVTVHPPTPEVLTDFATNLKKQGIPKEWIDKAIAAAKKGGVAAGIAVLLPFTQDDDNKSSALLGLLGTIAVGGKKGVVKKPFFSAGLKALEAMPDKVMPPPQIAKMLEKAQVKKAEISDIMSNITKPMSPVEAAKVYGERVIKLDPDVYGGTDNRFQTLQNDYAALGQHLADWRKERADPLTSINNRMSLREARTYPEYMEMQNEHDRLGDELNRQKENRITDFKGAPYENYFTKDLELPGIKPETYEVRRVAADIPDTSINQLAQRKYGKDFMDLSDEQMKKLDVSTPTWRETEHDKITTDNPVGGTILAERELTKPDGTPGKVLHVFEAQTPAAVKDTKNPLSPVPEPLRGNNKGIELAAKDVIAEAKRRGFDGVSFSTGAQTVERWREALTKATDRVTYNPETKEFKAYKDGRKVFSQKMPPEDIEKHIGKEPAKKLLESNITAERFDWKASNPDLGDGFYIDSTGIEVARHEDGNWGVYANLKLIKEKGNLSDAKLFAERLARGSATPKEPLHFLDHPAKITSRWPEELYGNVAEGGTYKPGTFANLLKKWSGGKLGVSVGAKEMPFKESYDGTTKQQQWRNDTDGFRIRTDGKKFYLYDRGELVNEFSSLSEAKNEATGIAKDDGRFKSGDSSPVVWLNDKTPSSFPIYEGTTSIFKMLQEQIKKEGGGATGVAKVALKYGVPAVIIAEYLRGDDKTRKNILRKYPKLKASE